MSEDGEGEEGRREEVLVVGGGKKRVCEEREKLGRGMCRDGVR